MSTDELATAQWEKSTRSNGQANCIERAHLSEGRVAIRESDDPASVVITTQAKWCAFLEGVRNGELD